MGVYSVSFLMARDLEEDRKECRSVSMLVATNKAKTEETAANHAKFKMFPETSYAEEGWEIKGDAFVIPIYREYIEQCWDSLDSLPPPEERGSHLRLVT